MARKRWVAALLLALVSAQCSSAPDRDRLLELNQRATVAATEHRWVELRAALLEIKDEMAGNVTPRWLLRMASVEARLGNKQNALHWLLTFSKTGLVYDIEKDADLAPLIGEPGFQKIEREFAQNRRPVRHAEVVCTIPQTDLMPEDIVYDADEKTFLVTSVQHSGLYRLPLPREPGHSCALQEAPLPVSAKRWPTLALGYERSRHSLWMTGSALPGFHGISKEDAGKTTLMLREGNGTSVQQVSPDEPKPMSLGDMTVSGNTIYVTDSLGGGVYRSRNSSKLSLEKISEIFSPQTPVVCEDSRRLLVPDYALGIAVVDLSNPSIKNLSFLPHPEDIAVTGIDGMYRISDSLIAIQNGTNPPRIVRFRLDPQETAIVAAEVLEQSEYSQDTNHAVAVDGWLYFLANVGWDQVDDGGNLKSGNHFTNPVLMRLPLGEHH